MNRSPLVLAGLLLFGSGDALAQRRFPPPSFATEQPSLQPVLLRLETVQVGSDRPVPLLAAAGLTGGALGFVAFSFLPAIACINHASESWMGCEATKIAGILGQSLAVPEMVFFANGKLREKDRLGASVVRSLALGVAAYGISKATGDLDSADFPQVYWVLPIVQTVSSIHTERRFTRKRATEIGAP